MMKTTTPFTALLGALLFAACGGEIDGDDEATYSELDRLRVLAIASDPPEVLPGQSVTLSALVFEPEGRAPSFAWSWCLVRSTTTFECVLPEADLRAAWRAAELPGEPPPYDLGTTPEATFGIDISEASVLALCDALLAAPSTHPDVRLRCLDFELEPSVRVRVSTADDEIDVVRALVFGDPEEGRNQNPVVGSELEIRRGSDDHLLAEGERVVPDVTHGLRIGIGDEQAESFGEPGAERRETLLMSWFITVGDFSAEDAPESLDANGPRTSFAEGGEMESLRTTAWDVPMRPSGEDARLFVVVRDERGGVGWGEFRIPMEPAS